MASASAPVATDTTASTTVTLSTPAGQATYTASVGWPLLAGHTYHLTSASGNNGRWVGYSAFPTTSGALSVLGTWGAGVLQTGYWFTFTNLNVC